MPTRKEAHSESKGVQRRRMEPGGRKMERNSRGGVRGRRGSRLGWVSQLARECPHCGGGPNQRGCQRGKHGVGSRRGGSEEGGEGRVAPANASAASPSRGRLAFPLLSGFVHTPPRQRRRGRWVEGLWTLCFVSPPVPCGGNTHTRDSPMACPPTPSPPALSAC
uniref:Uncharacterized protein n=2 Tax=Knipowitschia caucasica TaxID=637954 RepID=A0AAV2MUB6_KNICA